MGSIEDRLSKLEYSVARWKKACFVLVALIATAICVAAAEKNDSKFERISARSITIVDEKGREVGFWNHTALYLRGMPKTQTDFEGLQEFMDTPRVELRVAPTNAEVLVARGKGQAVRLADDSDGPTLRVFEHKVNGRILWKAP